MAERGSILCNDANIGALMNNQRKVLGSFIVQIY